MTRQMRTLVFGVVAAFGIGTAAAQSADPAGDSQAGQRLFETKGCYSCHGHVGQGGREGPRLTPPMAFPAFLVQLRTPRLIMPPYVESILSDREAADIHAYLANLAKPPDPDSIELLN